MNNEPQALPIRNNSTISSITRRNIFDEILVLGQNSHKWFFGRYDLVAFLHRIFPLDKMPSITDDRYQTAADEISQHMINNDDWDFDFLFNYLGLTNGNDEQLLRFLEEIVHPLVRTPSEQEEFVEIFNKHLVRDGYQLQARDQISGYPIYRAVRKGNDVVKQEVKNLIFAADGPKPEIVLEDSISNKIRIVKNEQYCLVYDLPIPSTGLRWTDLVDWWANRKGKTSPTIETERELYNRLNKSLTSEPERLFFYTYFKKVRSSFSDKLPALIPQVYLHYDPYTLRELQGSRRLNRQRMDFLILFSNQERIVIEIDGKQHYSDDDGKANSIKYSEMVAEDRKLRLAGYEIYRFGGHELQTEDKTTIIEEFIRGLFRKHGIT
jgi:very-short-patch-repair endonuclease